MLSYSLVVAKGYVRLVRTGSRPSRLRMPTSSCVATGCGWRGNPTRLMSTSWIWLRTTPGSMGLTRSTRTCRTSCSGDCTRTGVTVACRRGAG